MSHKDGRVVLSAWIDPALRDHVREAARLSGLEFSRWVERAVRQTMARESADRAIRAVMRRARVTRPEFVQSNECEVECPVCMKKFTTTHTESRSFCSVGCQMLDEPYRPRDVIGKRLTDLSIWRILVTAEHLEDAQRELRKVRALSGSKGPERA